MSWSRRFLEPIPLPSGELLRTLADARAYIIALPKSVSALAPWQAAISALLVVAEHKGPTDFARIGMMRALYPDAPLRPRRKARKATIIR